MELKNYKDEAPFPFGTLTVKDMTPETFTQLSMAVVDVPIGAEHPPFAEHRKDRYIRTSRALDWAAQAPSPEQRRNRLATIRRFALAMHAEDARHDIPPVGAFGRG